MLGYRDGLTLSMFQSLVEVVGNEKEGCGMHVVVAVQVTLTNQEITAHWSRGHTSRRALTMLHRFWKPVAATTVFVGAPSYLYYHYYFRKPDTSTVQVPVRIRGEDGQPVMTTRSFPLLTQSTVDERLREHAKEDILHRCGTTWRINTASVAANDPIEDAHTHAVIARDQTDPLAPGDWLFFAIMDGHAGPHTSRLLSKTLINAVVLELSNLANGTRSSRWFSTPKVQNPDTISLAIQKAFTKLDDELINAPLKVLAANMDKKAVASQNIPDLSKHPLALPMMLPAVSGAFQS